MGFSAWEQATLNFYEWDYRGRGYHFYNNQISIEPPYVPFQRKWSFSQEEPKDDGKVPSLLSDFIGFFKKKESKTQPKPKERKIQPNPASKFKLDTGFSFTFPKREEISNVVSTEFINLLSFSEAPISFEIFGTYDAITIQIICSRYDALKIESHLRAYFPSILIKNIETTNLNFDITVPVAICDFGLNDEFSRPIHTSSKFDIDPLTSLIATLDNLRNGEKSMLQIIFKGLETPWAKDIPYAVSNGSGESFFTNSPEMIDCAKSKVSAPLFSCIIRIATQGNTKEQSQYLATQISNSLSTVSQSEFNKLIPLSNKGYLYEDHLYNLYHRTSNRLGMILNTNELVNFVHYPNKSIVSPKIGLQGGKTKAIPSEYINQKYIYGINTHNGNETNVSVTDEIRLKHTHIIGATGTGKSTLIAQMVLEDIKKGNGCAVFDPHGDIIDDILERIPEKEKERIVIIDPSDTKFPVGFNLLSASTEAEKLLLSSDLVSSFKRYATAWGDNMTAVLSNAINTFLESEKGGTLVELKRFLLEDNFRKQFLLSVDDRSIHYYWKNEYPMMKKGITPLLTRIDTFLRPKLLRYMLIQQSGIDFKDCIEQKKVVLIKLSQGLIGQENSYLLGSLFISKFNQVALGRQVLSKEKRHPFYIYLDEFQNFITPSVTSILSGARKYGIGLILAHQELAQITQPRVLNSVISNPHSRICFRLGDYDAKRLDGGFSFFEEDDLQNLGVGEAIMRIGKNTNDFNISTFQLESIDDMISGNIKEDIISNTRKKYGKPISEIQTLLDELFPAINEDTIEEPKTEFSRRSDKKENRVSQEILKYQSLQNHIKALAIQRGFNVALDEIVNNDGRVDISLIKDNVKIAVEISITNKLNDEVENIQKCIDAGYDFVYMVSDNLAHLKNIRHKAQDLIKKEFLKSVLCFPTLELSKNLDSLITSSFSITNQIQGYRIASNGSNTSSKKEISSQIKDIPDAVRSKLVQQELASSEIRIHEHLQSKIKKIGQDRDYIATIEYPTKEGGRIDVVLERDGLKIGFEISETNKPSYEVNNIKKCLKEGCIPVIMVSRNKNHLNKIERLTEKELSKKDFNFILFIQPNEVIAILDGIQVKNKKNQEIVKGFRVITEFEQSKIANPKNIREHIAKLLSKRK